MIVYVIQNILNGKRYVGQTSHPLEHRWMQHLEDTLDGSHSYFHNAIRKNGIDAFKLKVLYTCSNKDTIDFYEKRFIHYYRTRDKKKGYNLTNGGDGGRKLEEET